MIEPLYTSLSGQLAINKKSMNYLNNTDWLVIRHRDQLDLDTPTSLTNDQYVELLNKRQEARNNIKES